MTISIDEYTAFVRSRKVYGKKGIEIIYPVLGLLGELGELAEKLNSYANDHQAILLEAGDVLWYILAVADDLGLTLHDIRRGYESASVLVRDSDDAVYYALTEAALLADKTKKILRDGTPVERIFAVTKLRSIFLGLMAAVPSFSLESVMQGNVDKLTGRVARGTIHGSGDNR